VEKAGQNGNSKDIEKRSWKNTVEVIEIQRCCMSFAASFHPCHTHLPPEKYDRALVYRAHSLRVISLICQRDLDPTNEQQCHFNE
jgi:hypothetical protein